MIKRLVLIFIVFVVQFSLISCEKVIDVDLNTAEPALIIEAALKEGENEFQVLISKTASYFGNESQEKINDAAVWLQSDSGEEWEIPNVGNGVYRRAIEGRVETTYTLKVRIDGVTYSATSFMPAPVLIDSIYAVYENGFGPIEPGYTIYVVYSDPPVESNYYRLKHELNGVSQNSGNDLQVFDDYRNNGNQARTPIFFKAFQLKDLVRVELVHFDESSYNYFSTLSDPRM